MPPKSESGIVNEPHTARDIRPLLAIPGQAQWCLGDGVCNFKSTRRSMVLPDCGEDHRRCGVLADSLLLDHQWEKKKVGLRPMKDIDMISKIKYNGWS